MKGPDFEKIREQAGILFSPKRLVKFAAGQIPIASIGVQMVDELEAHETELRIGKVEATAAAALAAAEKAAPTSIPPFHDWAVAVAEFLPRTLDLLVVYNSAFHGERPGRELFHAVSHGCITEKMEFLTCREAWKIARDVADHKRGHIMVGWGAGWYECEFDEADSGTGLCLGRMTTRDDKRWNRLSQKLKEVGLEQGLPEQPLLERVRHTVSPWMGQEFGFIHAGEADDAVRGVTALSKFQFDHGVISHFRPPSDDALKPFVSSVLGGRILKAGSPVFARDGNLLGIFADTANYESDAGRRAVVRSLLGHPKFMPQNRRR